MSTADARRYNEIITRLNSAGEELRRYEQRRISELATELADADERLRAAAEKKDRVRRSVAQWWRQAEQLLRGNRWLHVGSMPSADERAADGTPPPAGGIAHAYEELARSLRLAPWLPRPSRPTAGPRGDDIRGLAPDRTDR